MSYQVKFSDHFLKRHHVDTGHLLLGFDLSLLTHVNLYVLSGGFVWYLRLSETEASQMQHGVAFC